MRQRRVDRVALWWAVHNLIAHPVSELLWWEALIWEQLGYPNLADFTECLGNRLHDATIPKHQKGEGRG